MKDRHLPYLGGKFEFVKIKIVAVISISSFCRQKNPSFPWQLAKKSGKLQKSVYPVVPPLF